MASERRDWHAAQGAGVIFYELPELIAWDGVDDLIRPICQRVNASGWVATAESCQGHPDWPDHIGPWAGNLMPFLRLVCHRDDFGKMLVRLMEAVRPDPAAGYFSRPDMVLSFDDRGYDQGWAQVLVYMQARTVGDRNEGLAVFRRFAESLGAPDGQ